MMLIRTFLELENSINKSKIIAIFINMKQIYIINQYGKYKRNNKIFICDKIFNYDGFYRNMMFSFDKKYSDFIQKILKNEKLYNLLIDVIEKELYSYDTE